MRLPAEELLSWFPIGSPGVLNTGGLRGGSGCCFRNEAITLLGPALSARVLAPREIKGQADGG